MKKLLLLLVVALVVAFNLNVNAAVTLPSKDVGFTVDAGDPEARPMSFWELNYGPMKPKIASSVPPVVVYTFPCIIPNDANTLVFQAARNGLMNRLYLNGFNGEFGPPAKTRVNDPGAVQFTSMFEVNDIIISGTNLWRGYVCALFVATGTNTIQVDKISSYVFDTDGNAFSHGSSLSGLNYSISRRGYTNDPLFIDNTGMLTTNQPGSTPVKAILYIGERIGAVSNVPNDTVVINNYVLAGTATNCPIDYNYYYDGQLVGTRRVILYANGQLPCVGNTWEMFDCPNYSKFTVLRGTPENTYSVYKSHIVDHVNVLVSTNATSGFGWFHTLNVYPDQNEQFLRFETNAVVEVVD